MHKILFFDDYLVNRQRNIVRRWHTPEWLPQQLFIDRDTLFGAGYASVVPAPGGGLRLYYMAMLGGGSAPDKSAVLCLAQAPDGLSWEKATFSPARKEGKPQVVYAGSPVPSGCHVYCDFDDADPSRRYKMTDCTYAAPHRGRFLYSADGLDWRLDDRHPFLDWQADTQLHLLRNPVTSRYQIHLRPACGDRRIFRIESADLEHWSRPQLALHPDPLDPPMRHFYGMPQFRCGDLFLGLLWCYDTADEPGLFKHSGVVETELVYSYDGLTWNRTHRPFMPRREPGEYGYGSMYGSAIVEADDGLLVYAIGSLEEHQRALGRKPGDPPFNGILPGRMRKDGFVSLGSRAGVGELTTDCLYPRTPELSFNLRAPTGSVRVQVCDTECRPLPGYAFADCAELRGDGPALRPRWREHEDLSAAIAFTATSSKRLAGWVRLQVQMEMADLFSINGDFGLITMSGAPGRDRLA